MMVVRLIAFVAVWTLATPMMAVEARAEDSCPGYRTNTGYFVPTNPPKPMPDTRFTGSSGRYVDLAQLKGRPLLVNFWTSWCPPCLEELPSFNRLQVKAAETGLLVLPLNRDLKTGDLKTFLKKRELDRLVIAADRFGQAASANNVPSKYPITLFVDRDGREVGRVIGAVEWHEGPAFEHLQTCLDLAGEGVKQP